MVNDHSDSEKENPLPRGKKNIQKSKMYIGIKNKCY